MDKIFTKKNWNLLVGIIGLLVGFWLLMFAVPSLFVLLFHTFLGNLILLGVVLLVGMRNIPIALGLAAIFFIMMRSFQLNK